MVAQGYMFSVLVNFLSLWPNVWLEKIKGGNIYFWAQGLRGSFLND